MLLTRPPLARAHNPLRRAHHSPGTHQASRAENKARKAFQKLGLKSVPGVSRVVVKRGRQVYFVVAQPEVMKSGTNDNTYVFFGEAKQGEDTSAALQQAAALQFAQQQAAKAAGKDEPPALVETGASSTGSVDEGGVNGKHIDLVLEQVPSASRAQVRFGSSPMT